ncbi:hypothetical protein N7457_002101 [Penicillium paradoxum]|uniref:uncharacterized protein n=1 Tax=Penicillium paradoxum TaxID=176176 RepID=UPI0025471380|nr:uncharacterized protein N7457_002101 [Penicillium paradoxum]KAJ5787111.1 hypothetical protein N7457_002101 [Penicillium paradoxum]
MAMPTAKTLLLFGPGAMSLDELYFRRILAFVKDDNGSNWAINAIEDIESGWDLLSESIPKLQHTSGSVHARRLADWLRTGVISPQSTVSELPNAILGPLVIIAQLVEYLQHAKSSSQSSLESGQGFHLLPRAQTETVGCCLGVFSALVVSSSSSWAQFCHNAAAVLRTVFVLGALSDAQDMPSLTGPSISLIAFWRGGQSLADLKKALSKFPDAYISVLYDDNRATVTTSASTASALKSHLQTTGITANETEFHGRFHAGSLYERDLEEFFTFCKRHPLFQLPDASSIVLPIRVNSATLMAGTESMLEAASRAFLVEQFNWIKSFRAAVFSSLQDRNSKIVEFGPERCVPPTLLRRLNSQVIHFEFENSHKVGSTPGLAPGVTENDIAVIGMSCQVAGARDLEQYWKILLGGQSQHKDLIPNDRFAMDTTFRPGDDSQRKWYGNFIDDYDAFDHKFFKKSPREALHMDPQQRLILQTAYQAVVQSGYYHKPDIDRRIGCYIGCVANDYENNISHTTPTAFSATGALRSYISGKVSHYFGWTGPGMMIDTACSASTVAIDLACRAILSGDCSAALAGGTNFYSTPMFFQNLAAGSFLSPTGQCKPFDAKADGYCRGEAIGAVFLKKLTHAIADGDQVLGVISATAINQNQNDTPIFVPNPSSLTNVFQTVVNKAGLDIKDISVVEAHGTGTPVGDPAEYASIRQIFGGSARAGLGPLQVGSVKGLIGHTEGASGVVALIKMLLMMQEGRIPPQASFTSISPSIKATSADNMHITTEPMSWDEDLKVALINNYGAAGSNASMVIKQAPNPAVGSEGRSLQSQALASATSPFKCPVYISGLDDKAVRAYSKRLCQFIKNHPFSRDRLGIENMAFNINRQSNWSLGRSLIFSAESIDELEHKLLSTETAETPSVRPVILCFGGQVSKFVGLDRGLFEKATVLRLHLDRCDNVCKAIGAGSIYPGIFEREAIQDPSVLQPLLFSMQYSSAMSWIDCGIKPTALVGHSFGELTALCVSGALTLTDALKMIHGRSKVISQAWGPEKGSMIAVDGDQKDVESLLASSNLRIAGNEGNDIATIACFNGPRSFTIAGSNVAIDAVQETISRLGITVKHKRLDVTNAFHSILVEHLKPELEALGHKLSFGQPKIPLERATHEKQVGSLSAAYVFEHMRQPVYFNHAVQRLAKQHPEAVWLEAGSSSTITTMVSRALSLPKSSTFQAVNVTGTTQGIQQLADATINLWKAGLRVTFWPHSYAQTSEYAPIILPPYQFEKQRHWLEFKVPPKPILLEASSAHNIGVETDAPPTGLFTFLGYSAKSRDKCRFRINTGVKQYVDVVSGHTMVTTGQACPASFEIEIALQAITSIRPELTEGEALHPRIFNISNQAPMLVDPSREIFLDFDSLGSDPEGWNFKFTSKINGNDEVVHMIGQLYFQPGDDTHSSLEFSRLERLVTHDRCLRALESSDDADEVIQGRSIYKLLSQVIEYGERFRGLQKLVGRPNESVGRIIRRRSSESRMDFALSETFTQVGSIWANCMAPIRRTLPDTVYVICGIEQWMKSPTTLKSLSDAPYDDQLKEWHVLAQHKRTDGDAFITDIFVFESTSGSLEEVIIGIRYAPLSGHGFINSTPSVPHVPVTTSRALPVSQAQTVEATRNLGPAQDRTTALSAESRTESFTRVDTPKRNVKAGLWVKLLPVLADISGLEEDEINDTDSLADIGIDSLMGMEMAREVEKTFNCTLEQSELMNIFDIPGILSFLQSTLGLEDGNDVSDTSETTLQKTPASSNEAMPSTPSSMEDYVDLAGEQLDLAKGLQLSSSTILKAFRETKVNTDDFLKRWKCAGYLNGVSQKQTRLCLVLTSNAFKQLGCDLETAKPGEVLQPVPFVSRHHRFHDYLYKMLEEARIIDIDDGTITRTAIPLPTQTAEAILKDLMRYHPDDGSSHQLTYNVGSRMADVLSGKADGPQLIFGDSKNRELVAAFYGELPFNRLYFELMAEFLSRLTSKLRLPSQNQEPLKVLEMGAGTGGTTKVLVPALAKLGIPIEYTFTDLSPSLVAQAKKKFKQYPFMKFAVHDIEQPPSDPQLVGSQHIVIASNAVHATHSLQGSAQSIRKFLLPEGFLMLLEMNSTLHWVDVVWGTLEGWWLFDDGRTHAVVDERRWEKDLLSAGYKHVEWTDGKLPEVRVQRVIIALAGDIEQDIDRLTPALIDLPARLDDHDTLSDEQLKITKQAADEYLRSAIGGFSVPEYFEEFNSITSAKCVLVTGATGSLGSHIVAHLASLPSIDRVYCLNRPGKARSKDAAARDPLRRQIEALESKSITLDATALTKLKVIETDSSKPQLGLEREQYEELLAHVTHIIHNAFPVNGMLSLKQNEPQFAIMRSLVDLAAGVSARRKTTDFRFTFQFISSLSAVGKYPSTHRGEIQVPEKQLDIDSALPNGYGGAKVICERILLETLGKHPDRFRAMTVRLGQLSGSMKTGYWNHMEVLGFLFKSAQTLRSLPAVSGVLSWLPLEQACATLSDILLRDAPDCHPIYHVDNPVLKQWEELVPVLAEELGIPQKNVVPLDEWLRRVQAYPGENPWDNPAAKAIDFFEHKFEHMSCGGVTMATDNTLEHSATLRATQPIRDEVVRKYFQFWKETGFLR